MAIPLEHVIGLSAMLFAIGTLGVLTRRNLIVILMSIELMLNAVEPRLRRLRRAAWNDALDGQIFVLMVIIGRRRRGGGGPRHRDRAVPQPRLRERRRREPAQVVETDVSTELLRWIPLLPLLGGAGARRRCSALVRRADAARARDRALLRRA